METGALGAGPRGSGRPVVDRAIAFLHRHPIFCLFLMTPGFAEYTSGSSAFANLVGDPLFFLLQLGINAAMYTAGALLVREAMIRWRKGWPTAVLLGAAYAIMEEGIADQTIFTPSATHAPLGAAGVYGYFLGVDWAWLPDVFVIHILLSIVLPLVLLNYALPETRGRSLLSPRQTYVVLGILALDTVVLTAFVVAVVHFWYGDGLLFASLISIGLLCFAAWRTPNDLFPLRSGPPTASRGAFYVVGALTYPLEVLLAEVGLGRHLAAAPVVAAIALVPVLSFLWVVRNVGTFGHERHLVAFTLGALTIGMIFGIVVQFPLEFVVLFDAAVLYGLWRLDRGFAARGGAVSIGRTPDLPPGPASRATPPAGGP